MITVLDSTDDAPVRDARRTEVCVLVERRALDEAERSVTALLEEAPEDLEVLRLVAKVAHVRGALTEALMGWTDLRLRAPRPDRMRAELEAAYASVSRADPCALAVLGPSAPRIVGTRIEIVRAFAAFVDHREEEARERIAALVVVTAHREREAHKLAVLAGAFLAEQAGDLEGACRVLEALGAERGFETDVDRVRALAALYARSSSAHRLEAAVHVTEFLFERDGTASLLGRLASLEVRLGWKARAAEHTRRFVRAFAHEHFRVHDEVCVASVEGPSSRPGEVLAATSVRLPGGSQGLVQRVRVTRQSAREPVGGRLTRSSSKGPISAAHERAAAEVFRIVREHARARHPGRTRDLLAWDYAWELEVGDEWAPGFALGLPLAIALWSAFFDLPVPQDRCFAGALGADPGLAVPLHGIPFVAERVGGAYDRNLRTLVLPRACACDLADGSDVPAVVVDGLVTWVTTLDDAVRAAFPDAVLEVPVSPRPRDLVAAPR